MGIDIGEENLESRYNLHSMKHDHYVEIRLTVPRSNPKVPSVEQVWRIADWFERETYDMFGIEFVGHRDLRRILLPATKFFLSLDALQIQFQTYHKFPSQTNLLFSKLALQRELLDLNEEQLT